LKGTFLGVNLIIDVTAIDIFQSYCNDLCASATPATDPLLF